MRTQRNVIIILIVISWLLFGVMLAAFIDSESPDSVSIKTVDMIYKALENFIFLSIAGVFLFQQIDDHRSQKRHMLRVQTGLRTSVYYLTQFTADFSLYLFLNIPSLILVLAGYRHQELPYVDQSELVGVDIMTKVAFGCILLPIVYLIGFL